MTNNSSRGKVLVFNWKMNPLDQDDLNRILTAYCRALNTNLQHEIIICPPSLYIDRVSTYLDKKEFVYILGCQDIIGDIIPNLKKGAFTGQISSAMYKAAGCEATIVGHSEIRQYLNITNQQVAQKIKTAIENDLRPILCVGHEPYDKTPTDKVNLNIISEQILTAFEPYLSSDNHQIYPMVVYEPLWAIGTGLVPTQNQISMVSDHIYQLVSHEISANFASNLKILYGGSVNAENITDLNKIENIDGYLIGGASVEPEQIYKLFDI